MCWLSEWYDVNLDGEITIYDVISIVNYCLGVIDNPFSLTNADVNQDGEISINDVLGVVNIILNE